MSEEKSTIYISKRCQYCRQLLGILKNRPDVRGTIKIVVIDVEPFPNIVKNVPAMIDTKGELWSAQEIFSALNESETQGKQQQQQIQQQRKGQPPPHPQQRQQLHPSQQQGQQLHPSQQQGQPQQQKAPSEGMFDGYCESGSCLAFSPLDDMIMDTTVNNFAPIDNQTVAVNVQNDGYVPKSQKSQVMDSDYEKMMAERGKLMAESGPQRYA
jgi:arsenate reductase-like glutaredoxin family protein